MMSGKSETAPLPVTPLHVAFKACGFFSPFKTRIDLSAACKASDHVPLHPPHQSTAQLSPIFCYFCEKKRLDVPQPRAIHAARCHSGEFL